MSGSASVCEEVDPLPLSPQFFRRMMRGERVVTRCGRPVRVICYDRVKRGGEIVALIPAANGLEEVLASYGVDGRNYMGLSDLDLVIA